jgi:hypothetical protein
LVIGHNQEQRCQTMKLERAIAAIVLVFAFVAPVPAGTFEDAVDAHARRLREGPASYSSAGQ